MFTKKPFLTVKSDCHDLVSLKNFPKITYKSVQYFNLGHVHKPKFGLLRFPGRFEYFLTPFLFTRPFYSRSLRFIFFLAAVKTWVLIMGKAWKWGLNQL